jgi:phage tail-like protein
MDINGTRFQLLLGGSDWAACLDAQAQALALSWQSSPPRDAKVRWDAERQEVTFAGRLFKFVASKNDRAPELEDRRGAARDRFGNWFWVAESGGELLVNSAGTSRTSHFWSAHDDDDARRPTPERAGDFRAWGVEPPPPARRFGGLAVTEEHFLVVGVVEPAGLLLFDLHTGGPPRQLCWPTAGTAFVPFDMSPAPGGGVLVLDRENRRFWTFDRKLNVVRVKPAPAEAAADDFQPLEGGEVKRTSACAFPARFSADDATHIVEGDPIAIEAMPDGTALVLFNARDKNARFSEIRRFRGGAQLGKALSTEGAKDWIEGGANSFRLVGYDFAYVPASETRADGSIGALYVVATSGNQSFAFEVYPNGDDLELRARPDYIPMRLFGGKALATAGAEVFYDFNDRFIPLVIQKRPRYESDVVFYTPIARASGDGLPPASESRVRGAFDGREPDCVWHRLLIDACIPPETGVEISSRAADDQVSLALAAWEPEPRLRLRGNGSELPFVKDTTDAARGTGTWELLFQKARGRFLQLRIRLTGNGRATPRLRALRAYYPRFSYLTNYLPAVYREDAESASFLDRFLANFEGFFTTIEDRVAAAQALLDPVAAPAEALDWLAGWFGVALDPAWDEARRRLFIRHAMQFFQWRGTSRGLETALQLALGSCDDDSLFETRSRERKTRTSGIRIVERFRTRALPGVIFGDPTDTGADAGSSTRWLKAEGAASQAAVFKQASSGCRCGQGAATQKGAGANAKAAASAEGAEVSAAERARWQGYLRMRYEAEIVRLNAAYGLSGALAWEDFSDVPLPSDLPRQSKAQADWLEWVETVAPSASTVERRMWQDFLTHRYGNVNALNVAYGTRWPRFSVVSLPDAMPPAAAAADWQQFVGVTLRMRRGAHTFTVMLPITKTFYTDLSHHRERRSLAERIINLEKPAHTVFDVKFYWAMFSVGGARLGDGLPLDRGSRAAQLMPLMTLGQQFLAESYLAPSHPQDVSGRQVVGRDTLRRRDAQTGRMTPSR